MENAIPFVPVPPNGLLARITQELNELRVISAIIDSHLKNVDHTMLLNEIDLDDPDSKDELIDTPLVYPFLDSNDESDNREGIGEFIVIDMADVVMGRTFRAVTQLEYDCVKGEDTSQPPPPPIASTEAPQMVSSVKLPILKKGEYILWTMKIEQYLAHTDYVKNM
uniref:Uncharacterized protein n=1 Tax=Tanacetum cinerariifolium TaxID=118510 RepID=A0A6L2MY93_TANCI|nr:hypothetical protein [Tanacetum cinerariifolium]